MAAEGALSRRPAPRPPRGKPLHATELVAEAGAPEPDHSDARPPSSPDVTRTLLHKGRARTPHGASHADSVSWTGAGRGPWWVGCAQAEAQEGSHRARGTSGERVLRPCGAEASGISLRPPPPCRQASWDRSVPTHLQSSEGSRRVVRWDTEPSQPADRGPPGRDAWGDMKSGVLVAGATRA